MFCKSKKEFQALPSYLVDSNSFMKTPLQQEWHFISSISYTHRSWFQSGVGGLCEETVRDCKQVFGRNVLISLAQTDFDLCYMWLWI
jgi:hypothetical protein